MIIYELKTEYCKSLLQQHLADRSALGYRWDYRDDCTIQMHDLILLLPLVITAVLTIGFWRIGRR